MLHLVGVDDAAVRMAQEMLDRRRPVADVHPASSVQRREGARAGVRADPSVVDRHHPERSSAIPPGSCDGNASARPLVRRRVTVHRSSPSPPGGLLEVGGTESDGARTSSRSHGLPSEGFDIRGAVL
jgi:hypothetical protein